MARDRANINTGIWNDADYRRLSPAAQWLYFLLMTHPTLTYVGVADWRPKRITPFAAGLTARFVEDAAAELEAGLYIVIDEDTEEVLVRSFVKHDGILKQPRLAVSMANAYAQTASNTIRGVVVHELRKQREAHPEYQCWGDKRVADILSQPSVSPSDLPPLGDGFTPNLTPGFGPTEGMPTSTATATTTPSSNEEGGSGGKPSRATQLPADWKPTDKHAAIAAERNIDVELEAEKFRDWCGATGRTYRDHDLAFNGWLRRAHPDRDSHSRPNRDAASSEALVQAHYDMQAMGGHP